MNRLIGTSILFATFQLNVLSDDAYARAKAKSLEVAKVRLSSYKEFAKFVSISKDSLDPRHSHVQIQSDGTRNLAARQRYEGWRIVALTYSSSPHAT